MRHIIRPIVALLALAAAVANAAVPVQIVSAQTSATSLTIAFTAANVTPGDTLVLEALTYSSAPTSVTESLSETVNTRISWPTHSGSITSFSAYDVLNSAGNAKVSFTINVATSQPITAILAEYPKADAASFAQATPVAYSAGSTTASSASLTPVASGELAVAMLVTGSNGDVATWSNGFAKEAGQISNAGAPPYVELADQILSSTSPVAAAATLSAADQWSIAELLYKPATSSCTDPGVPQSATAFAIPTASSTVMRLKNGTFGTVDCSTVSYKFQSGIFGTSGAAVTQLTDDAGANILTDDSGTNTLTSN